MSYCQKYLEGLGLQVQTWFRSTDSSSQSNGETPRSAVRLNLVKHIWSTYICSPSINTPSASYPLQNAWRTSEILRQKATDDNHQPVCSVEHILSISTGRRQNAQVIIRLSLQDVCQEAFSPEGDRIRRCFPLCPECRGIHDGCSVSFEKFKYVATCGRVSKERLFPHAFHCCMSAHYCMGHEETGLSYHPKCIYVIPPPPNGCYRIHIFVRDRTHFIAQFLHGMTLYCCAKCATHLFHG